MKRNMSENKLKQAFSHIHQVHKSRICLVQSDSISKGEIADWHRVMYDVNIGPFTHTFITDVMITDDGRKSYHTANTETV